MRFPIGVSTFRDIIDTNVTYVDKTMFVDEVLDDTAKAILILRPRRFGKTLNLSMLHHFLSDDVNEQSTSHLFKGLKISSKPIFKEQGQHPVIFVTFKDMKEGSYEAAVSKYRSLMSNIYSDYAYLLKSDLLDSFDKEAYLSIRGQTSTVIALQEALYQLSKYLTKHHKKKTWVLMDEYDAPLLTSYEQSYYDDMCGFMRGCLSPLLKDNSYLYKAVITGILKISKESLFSGVNNLKVYSMLNHQYAEHFGFTEDEVLTILEDAGLASTQELVKHWYNGYCIDHAILYNPWSISMYVDSGGKFDLYWVNTAEDTLLRKVIINSTDDFKQQFETLLSGQSITTSIDFNLTFKNIMGSQHAIWSLLYLSGHLRVLHVEDRDEERQVTFNLPNREIRRLMNSIIYTWLSPDNSTAWFRGIIDNLLQGDVHRFEIGLQDILNQVVSCHDVARSPECFYHGFMMGMTAYLYNHSDYKLSSNRESAKGRFDYMILSNNPQKLSILFEFKRIDKRVLAKNEHASSMVEMLRIESKKALEQIHEKQYITEAAGSGSQRVLVVGLAFCGKDFEMTSDIVVLK